MTTKEKVLEEYLDAKCKYVRCPGQKGYYIVFRMTSRGELILGDSGTARDAWESALWRLEQEIKQDEDMLHLVNLHEPGTNELADSVREMITQKILRRKHGENVCS